MRIAICDDEKYFIEILVKQIEAFYGVCKVEIETFVNGKDFMERFKRGPYEFTLIFMDIEMPGMTGLEVANQILEHNDAVPVIFLTSHVEMAMEGYRVSAFRFLQKPIELDKLYEALREGGKVRSKGHIVEFCDGNKSYLINAGEILYLKSENVYVNLFMKRGNHLIRSKISQFEEKLHEENFFRPHRSYLINICQVHNFDGKSIIMNDGQKIPISRSRSNHFKEIMASYLRTLNEGHGL